MSIFETDIWRIGIIKAPMAQVLSFPSLEGQNICWLDKEPSFRFLADPFGFWKDEKLYLFAEAYDYRDRKGRIEVLIFDSSLELCGRKVVLEEPWHLSYPMIVEEEGQIYMLPEAYQSGQTTLYRATEFPYHWEKVPDFSFPEIVIDPTLLLRNGYWWLFYTPVTPNLTRQGMLSVAWAEHLKGPWHLHPANPVRITPSSSRPGGSALITEQGIILPTQNCSYTYGGSLSLLAITTLTPTNFEAHILKELKPTAICGRFNQGLHTLSAVGNYTLVDVKKMVKSPIRRLAIDALYRMKKDYNSNS